MVLSHQNRDVPFPNRDMYAGIKSILVALASRPHSEIRLTEASHKHAHDAAAKNFHHVTGIAFPTHPHLWQHILYLRLFIQAHMVHNQAKVDKAWGHLTPWRESLCANLSTLLRAPTDHTHPKYQSLHPECWHLDEIAHEFPQATLDEFLAILDRMMHGQEEGMKRGKTSLLRVLKSIEEHEHKVGCKVEVEPEPRPRVVPHVSDAPHAGTHA